MTRPASLLDAVIDVETETDQKTEESKNGGRKNAHQIAAPTKGEEIRPSSFDHDEGF